MSQASRGSRVVFVGNIPFEMTEEQLIDIFKEVGPVASFRLLFDRESKRPKGYGFCEYYDAETAASAVRNLNDYDVGGRQLRVDYAAMDPHVENQRQHKQHNPRAQQQQAPPPPPMQQQQQHPMGFPPMGGPPMQQQMQQQMPQPMPPPQQQQPPVMNKQGTSVDEISKVLASMTSQDLFTLMTHMKQMSYERPQFTREFLNNSPQVAYALFQAMVMMNIVDPNIITRILSNPAVPRATAPVQAAPIVAAPVPPPPVVPMIPQQQQHVPPPMMTPQVTLSHMQSPLQQQQQQLHQPLSHMMPPQQPQLPQQQPMAVDPGVDVKEQQKALLRQVMQLTDEQINALAPEHRDQIRQLKAQLVMSQPQ